MGYFVDVDVADSRSSLEVSVSSRACGNLMVTRSFEFDLYTFSSTS